MNKNTANAIQGRINAGQTEFTIGSRRYICYYDHPAFRPYVLRYDLNGGGEPFHAGNIDDGGRFVPADVPERRPGLKWYAVMTGPDDTDWGEGSYDRTEAEKMVVKNLDIYPDGYIAVIDGGECVEEIAPEDFSGPYCYAARIVKAHDWEECRDDLDSLMDLLDLGGEWAEADGESFEAVIQKAGEKIGIDLM